MHFNWLHIVPKLKEFPEHTHVFAASLVTLLLVAISLWAYAVAPSPEEGLIPEPGVSARNIFESIVEFLYDLITSIIDHGDKFVPFVGSFFLFIFLNNLSGLVPGFTPATDNLNTSIALGLVVFVYYNFMGLKENGFGYIKHMMGPVWYMAILIFPIELISNFVRPLSLGLRLAKNMSGDHEVLNLFLGLVPWAVPMVFYLLGIFVCFVQAFVFTLLTSVYISMATAHDH